MAMGIVGGINIFAGILLYKLLYIELMEGHRSSLSWSKFGRNISVELALDEKFTFYRFFKNMLLQFDRLIEHHPSIDDKIIKLFDYQFKDSDIILLICNGIKKCKIYKPYHMKK